MRPRRQFFASAAPTRGCCRATHGPSGDEHRCGRSDDHCVSRAQPLARRLVSPHAVTRNSQPRYPVRVSAWRRVLPGGGSSVARSMCCTARHKGSPHVLTTYILDVVGGVCCGCLMHALAKRILPMHCDPVSCARCQSEPPAAACGAVVCKEWSASGGLGRDCGVGHACCYLITVDAVGPDPTSNCDAPCVGWDSWAAVGIPNGTAPPPTAADTQFLWRDKRVARTMFSDVRASGTGAETQWHLTTNASDATTGALLRYTFTVHANGTIFAMTNASGHAMVPLRQFRRVPPFH
eukprot:m.718451 g.718451  ORF g.718451 m.718451 type:complete len:293 (+) comp22995_c0_seq2:5691-6569(+)